MQNENIVTPFIIENLSIRGRIAQLNSAINNIIERHNYPEKVSHLIAQITTLATLLGSNLKNNERFSIQIRSNGAIKLLICDFNAPNSVRSYAKFEENELNNNNLLGEGTITFTINEPGTTPLYQAIVELEGNSIEKIAEKYYEQSEQIPTKIKLFSAILINNKTKQQQYRAGGIVIQFLPNAEQNKQADYLNITAENWNEAKILTQTITQEELLEHETISANKLLFRLFNQYDIRVFEPINICDICSCSKERIVEVVKNFSKEELEHSSDNGIVSITCQFCSKKYDINI